MNKINYTLKSEKIQELKRNINKIKREFIEILEKSSVIKRKRVIKNYEILFNAVYHYISDSLSFQRLSDFMFCKYGIKMSDTAWKKQFNKITKPFFHAADTILNPTFQDKEIYAIDATNFSSQGSKGTTMRIHTQFSLSNRINSKAIITNEHTAESLRLFEAKPNALYIADRVYGKSNQLSYLYENHADFLIRISPNLIQLYTSSSCTKRIDFKSLMHKKTFSKTCFFKFNGVCYKTRLIGVIIPEEKQFAVEKRVRRKSQKNQIKISKTTLEYSKWMFLITSLGSNFKTDNLIEMYRDRWQIELFFKRSKTLLNFHKIRRSSCIYMTSVVYAWMGLAMFLSKLQLIIFSHFNFHFSSFNAFSLAINLIS